MGNAASNTECKAHCREVACEEVRADSRDAPDPVLVEQADWDTRPAHVSSDEIPLWKQRADELKNFAIVEHIHAPSKSGSEASTIASITDVADPPEAAHAEEVKEVEDPKTPVKKTNKAKSKQSSKAKAAPATSLPNIADAELDLSSLTDNEKKQILKDFVNATGALGGMLYELQGGTLIPTTHCAKSTSKSTFFEESCYQFKFIPGQGLPGRAFNDPKRAKILADVLETTPVNFTRKDVATEAGVRSFCAVRYGKGVLEVAFKKTVEQPPAAMKPLPAGAASR